MLEHVSNSHRDTADLRLSSSQLEVFDGWKRPEEVFSTSNSGIKDEETELGPTMVSHAKLDLVQDITTDCSVVASLCAGTARVERGHSRVGNDWHDRAESRMC